MKRISTVILALLVVVSPAFGGTGFIYGWTISSSNSDPFVNTGPVTSGLLPLHLWLQCAPNGGMSAAEFDLQTPPGVVNAGFNVLNGFLNAGSASHLLLAVGGCPEGPVIAGYWNVLNTAAGSYCLVQVTGDFGTVDCDVVSPQLWSITQKGYGAGGAPTCDEDLCVTAVEPTSWGSVKSLYR